MSPTNPRLETPAQFFARGGVVTVVGSARARGFVESLIRTRRQTVSRTGSYKTVTRTHSNLGRNHPIRITPERTLT